MAHSVQIESSPQGSQYSGARSHTGSVPVPPTPMEHLYSQGQVTPSPTTLPSSQPPVAAAAGQHPAQDVLSHQVHIPQVHPQTPTGFVPQPVTSGGPPKDVSVPISMEDEDDLFDHYSQMSTPPSPFEMHFPPAPVGNYIALLTWISTHFPTYFSIHLQTFFLAELHLVSVSTMNAFFKKMDMQSLVAHLGEDVYDYWRLQLIDFKLVWMYIRSVFNSAGSTGTYGEFLRFRGAHYPAVTAMVPPSHTLRPPPYSCPVTTGSYSHAKSPTSCLPSCVPPCPS
jgi:hypothetical protein